MLCLCRWVLDSSCFPVCSQMASTELVKCKGYPVTEVLAMLTLGIEDTVEGNIRNKLKRLGNQIGQFIIGKPWTDNWDELGGQVRNNKSLILTDLTYQTRSSSKAVHDIEEASTTWAYHLSRSTSSRMNPLRNLRNSYS